MSKLIRKYSKGTPKPFSVAVKKVAGSEQEASQLILASEDRKATAVPSDGKYVVRYRRWFDDFKSAQAFVDTAKQKTVKTATQATAAVVDAAKVEEIKGGLTKLADFCEKRGLADLAAQTKTVLAKL